MKRAALSFAIAALLVTPAAALAQTELFGELNTDEEVPSPTVPGDYAGTGYAEVVISADDTQISYEVTFEGLTGPLTMAHIHSGEVGAAGPPIFWLTQMGVDDTPSPLTGTLTEADFVPADGGPQTFAEAVEALRAGSTYVNLHTAQNPPGEIRGQLEGGLEGPDLLPPDTATADAPASSLPWTIVIAAFGLGLLLLVTRRLFARLD